MGIKPKSREKKLQAVQYCKAASNGEAYTTQAILQTAATYGVCKETVKRWLEEYDVTGDVLEPQNTIKRGRKARKTITTTLDPAIAQWIENRAKQLGITKCEYIRKTMMAMYKKAKAKEAETA